MTFDIDKAISERFQRDDSLLSTPTVKDFYDNLPEEAWSRTGKKKAETPAPMEGQVSEEEISPKVTRAEERAMDEGAPENEFKAETEAKAASSNHMLIKDILSDPQVASMLKALGANGGYSFIGALRNAIAQNYTPDQAMAMALDQMERQGKMRGAAGRRGAFLRSYDIDSRMAQWDAANRSQHSDQTESILKGGNPYVYEKMGRNDFEDPENVFQFIEGMFGPFDYGDDEEYLRLRSILEKNPELARSLMAAVEQTSIQNGLGRPRGEGYHMPSGKNQDPEKAMNRIGADKPRQGFWEEYTYTYPEPDGEGGYYSEKATEYDDTTEDKPGPTGRAKEVIDGLFGSGADYGSREDDGHESE